MFFLFVVLHNQNKLDSIVSQFIDKSDILIGIIQKNNSLELDMFSKYLSVMFIKRTCQ